MTLEALLTNDPSKDVPIFTAAGAGSALGRDAFVGASSPAGSAYLLVRANSGVSGGHHSMGAAKADQISQMVGAEAFVLHASGAPDF